MTSDRFHLTLTVDGRPAMHGWWGSEATARAKFLRWVGWEVTAARVVLVDEETGTVLDEWPGVVGPPS